MAERPKVGLGVIVVRGNKVLVGRRLAAGGKGTWCFPGGHLEFNEELEDGARREVKEEASIGIKNVKVVAVTNDINKEEGTHYITIFFRAEYDSGVVKANEPDKIADLKWVEWDKLPRSLFLPTINLLKQGYNPFKN